MARLHTSFVLGYHGCSPEVGEKVLAGAAALDSSDQDYDWLGPGIYFWESDPLRAWEWASWKVERGACTEPFVLGAVIDLGHCLDLTARASLDLVANTDPSLDATTRSRGATTRSRGLALPRNRPGRAGDPDNLLRFLDCAVLRHLHALLADRNLPSFDSVRGLFMERGALFPGSGFQKKTNVQIAVRNTRNIKGVFRVPHTPIEQAAV